MPSYEKFWTAAVHVKLKKDEITSVECAGEALAILERAWPGVKGKHYHVALAECRNSLQVHGKLAVAREAFMAAALEAGVLSAPVLLKNKFPIVLQTQQTASEPPIGPENSHYVKSEPPIGRHLSSRKCDPNALGLEQDREIRSP